MAAENPIYGNALSMMDIASHSGSDGKYLKIIEILSENNPILQDLKSVVANNGMFHVSAIRTGLPQGSYRAFYQGVPTEKATVTQIQESCAMLESFAKPDARLIDLNADRGNVLISQNKAFIEGLGQHQARTLFYGDPAINPNEFRGLSARYNSIGTDERKSSFNVIDAGGAATSTELTSAWIINWGEDKIHGIYPKGSVAGLRHEDLGKKLAQDSNGHEYMTYVSHYMWDLGLMVSDWRWAIRIANIDVSALKDAGKDSYTGPQLGLLLWDALEKIQGMSPAGCSFYAARPVWGAIQKLAQAKGNLALQLKDWNGQILPTIGDIPIKVCDAISRHENHVPTV